MKTFLVVAHMHKRDDKRVLRTVNALAETMKVIFVYWTENADEKTEKSGNILFVPRYFEFSSSFSARRQYESALARYVSMY